MNKLKLSVDPKVNDVYLKYPDSVKKKMAHLRELIVKTAEETKEITHLEETLKWGEPSFLTKHGSTLRMDWKSKTPDQYALYFKCTSRLVETFKLVYGTRFSYEGSRAIVFKLDDPLPETELSACIRTTLMYHKVKHISNLGL